MATITTFLGSTERPIDRVWDLVVTHKDATTGILEDSVAPPTYAIYSMTAGTWWKATTSMWEAAREENVLDNGVELTGIYNQALDPVELIGGEIADLDVLVFVTTSAPEAQQQFHLLHSPVSQPIEQQTLTAAPVNVGQLLTLLSAVLGGNAVLDDSTKQLRVYMTDPGVAVMTWDTEDAAGNPTTMEPFSRLVP